MNANKYANLPDIDSAQDIYETEDAFDSRGDGNSSEEESGTATRTSASNSRVKNSDNAGEGLDSSNLIGADEAAKKFRKAERRREQRSRLLYSYPDSASSSPSTSPTRSRPHNDGPGEGSQFDTGELMRELVDVRGRLERVNKGKEGRRKLVDVICDDDNETTTFKTEIKQVKDTIARVAEHEEIDDDKDDQDEGVALAELDRRVGELENLIGSSSVALDESSPLPAPLLPMLTKLNAQLALLTQPRHLDSILRRIKLLISDLDRLNSLQHAQASSKRGQNAPVAQSSTALQEQLLPLLARLAPHLPHLPHMLTRMRTLSSLHVAAADFQGSLLLLEQEQTRGRTRLEVLTRAVEGMEKSLEENASVVRGNVGGLEERVDKLMQRLDALV